MRNESLELIRFRLISIFIVAVTVVITLVFFLNHSLSSLILEDSQIGKVINISGRQRMLSQNISKTSVLIVDKRNSQASFQDLDSLITLFDSSHQYLKYQNKQLAIPTNSKVKLDSLFDLSELSRNTLIESGLAISNRDTSNYERWVDQLLHAEGEFLPIMDQITGEYELVSNHILTSIESKVSQVDYIIAVVVMIAALIVLFITLNTIKGYSENLALITHELHSTISEKNFEIEKFEFLTQAIKVGIWERNVLQGTESWSNQLFQIFGYEIGEIPGTYDEFLNRVHPNDRQLLIDASEASMKTGIPTTIEMRILTKNGSYKWIEATGNIKRDEFGKVALMVGGIEDIEDRKILENQLKVFVEHAPAAIAMFNGNIEYLAASKKWIKNFDLEEKIIMGISHYDLIPGSKKEWKSVLDKCLKGSSEQRDEVLFIGSDKQKWLKWEVRPWHINEDEVGGLLMFAEDITNDKKREEELRNAKEQAEVASKAKEQFLATMSHEIRTPLTAIIGLTHILLSEDPRADQVENLQLLRFSGDNLLTLINDILDISKIESGKLSLENTDFDLFYLFDNIKRSLAYRADENMINIEVDYDKKLPMAFVGDVTRITQIIYNLAGNAIKFSNGGTVKITAELLQQRGHEYDIKISVLDNGIGISPENQKKIFQSFEQAETGITRQFGGTGLGLYITKRLLEMMNSEIHLESELGKGSNFYFVLNLKKGSTDIISSSSDYEFQNLRSKNVSVLVAEDNKTNQTIISKFLRKSGIDFSIASNGLEVVELVKAKSFDLIFMDLQMPGMDGYEATIKIRSEKDVYFKKIPIIALTADAFINMKDKAISIGITDYLSKPFNPSGLYGKINKYAGIVDKVQAKKSKIENLINEFSESDSSFKHEFADHILYNFQTFLSGLKIAVKKQDHDKLNKAIEDIASLIDLLEQDELLALLGQLNKKNDFYTESELIEKITRECDLIIVELDKIKNH